MGVVVVNIMLMLCVGELSKIVDKVEVEFVFCDMCLMDEMVVCVKIFGFLKKVVGFDGIFNYDVELD